MLPVFYRKGIGSIFPNLASENAPHGAVCGNANELGDVGGSPGKSSLFLLRDGLPGIGLAGDRDVVPVKHRLSCVCPVHFRRPLKIRGRQLSCQIVPISAAGLQGAQPLVDRTM